MLSRHVTVKENRHVLQYISCEHVPKNTNLQNVRQIIKAYSVMNNVPSQHVLIQHVSISANVTAAFVLCFT